MRSLGGGWCLSLILSPLDMRASLLIPYKGKAVVSLGTHNVAGCGKRAARNLNGRNPN